MTDNHEQIITSVSTADRNEILSLNQELRKTPKPMAAPDGDSGHLAFLCPTTDYWYWVSVYPELGASDPQIAGNAWRKFLNTPEGEKYKINPNEGKKGAPFKRGVIIR